MGINQQTKKRISVAAILIFGILAGLLNLIIFTVFKPGNLQTLVQKQVFWFSYAFLMLAFVFQFIALYVGRYKDGAEAMVLGFPLVKVSIFYLVITAVLSLVMMTLVAWGVNVPFPLMMVLQCIVVGIYAVLLILCVTHQRTVVDIGEELKQHVYRKNDLRDMVANLADMVTDNVDLKKLLSRLSEDIGFSDPVGTSATAQLDADMEDAIVELSTLVETGKYDEAVAKVNQIKSILMRRKRALANSK